MYLFFGVVLIIAAVIEVVFVDQIFEMHESWKYNGDAEPSDEYLFWQYIGAGVTGIIGLILIIAYIFG